MCFKLYIFILLISVSISTPPILVHPDTKQLEHTTPSSLPNSCIGLQDGEYWFLLSSSLQSSSLSSSSSSSLYKPVRLSCSNEYLILDVNKDPNLKNYFSSFEKWHHSIAGPSNNDPVSWEEWFLNEDLAYNDNDNDNDLLSDENDDNNESSYLISPDCSLCEEDSIRQVYNTKTSYWMTGNLAKLHWGVIGFNECDMDIDTYQCYSCQSCMIIGDGCSPEPYNETTKDYSKAGICGVTVEESYHQVYKHRKIAQASSGSVNYKPSIGTNGKFCMCYKPNKLEYFGINDEQMDHMEDIELKLLEGKMEKMKHANNNNNKNNDLETLDENVFESQSTSTNKDMRNERIIYLSQEDFSEGTYRIKESGTYIITEDIEFDFNKDDDWWPTESQQNKYPGAATYRDPYHLGFFAAITIETDYVTIDLNGKELKQSLEFYYQQRWFAIIELGNQQFLPGQGPAFFGPNPVTVSDIIIKDGTLGRTSHFAIHGNYPTNLIIDNVRIKEFVTHGLQLNGWKNVIINNVEVGPSSKIEYLKGDYAHGRIIQQRLRAIENFMIGEGSLDKSKIKFSKHDNNLYYRSGGVKPEEVSISDIADELDLQMLLAFDYAMNRASDGKYKENGYISPEYYNNEDIYTPIRMKEVLDTFIHQSGLPSASSITGLFLNFEGASVFSYTMYTTHQSSNAYLNNIYIHDIYHDMVESTRLHVSGASGQLFPTPWNSDIAAEYLVGGNDVMLEVYDILINYADDEETQSSLLSNYKYIGSIMTDAYFAMAEFSDDFSILGFLQTENVEGDLSLIDWVKGKGNIQSDWLFGCNQDIMGHSGKGLLGLRLDGVINVELNNVIIENLHEHSKLGSDACGQYQDFSPDDSGGHFKQSLPTQYGFSGNDLQAMSIISSTDVTIGNVYINTLYNDYSQAFGMSFWTANDVTIDDHSLITVKDIISGKELELGTLSYTSKPNRAPETCAIRLEIDTQKGDDLEMYESTITIINENNIHSCNLQGHVKCLGGIESDKEDTYTMFGLIGDESTVCELIWSDAAGLYLRYIQQNGHKMDQSGDFEQYKQLIEEWEKEDEEENENIMNVHGVKKTVIKNMKGIKNGMEAGASQNSVLYQMSVWAFAAIATTIVLIVACIRFFIKKGKNSKLIEKNDEYQKEHNHSSWKENKEVNRSTYGDYFGDNEKCKDGNETYIGDINFNSYGSF